MTGERIVISWLIEELTANFASNQSDMCRFHGGSRSRLEMEKEKERNKMIEEKEKMTQMKKTNRKGKEDAGSMTACNWCVITEVQKKRSRIM